MRTKSPDELAAEALYDLLQRGELTDVDSARRHFGVAISRLERLLMTEDDNVLLAALQAAGAWRWCGPIALDRFATDRREEIRLATAQALASAPSATDLPALLQLATDPSPEVRDWAVFAIASVDEPSLREIDDCLANAAIDDDDRVRGEAVSGLVKRRDPRALPLLRRYFDTAHSIGTLAVEAARDLAHPELHAPLSELKQWWDIDPELLDEAIEACRPQSD